MYNGENEQDTSRFVQTYKCTRLVACDSAGILEQQSSSTCFTPIGHILIPNQPVFALTS